MPETKTGIRRILSIPGMYRLFGRIIGRHRVRTTFVNEYHKPKIGDRILDIGCGPGDLVPYLPDVQYRGYDADMEYIQEARRRFGDKCEFIHGEVDSLGLDRREEYDLVIAYGVLHHLGDDDVLRLFAVGKEALRSGGRLLTIDGVYTQGQSQIAKCFLASDRGRNIRTQAEYMGLARRAFPEAVSHMRSGLLRVPYNHLIMECGKP